jgi:hypothetical protein
LDAEEGSTGTVRAFLAGRPIGEVDNKGCLWVWFPFGPVGVVGITGGDWEVHGWPWALFKSGEEVHGVLVMDEGGVDRFIGVFGCGRCLIMI